MIPKYPLLTRPYSLSLVIITYIRAGLCHMCRDQEWLTFAQLHMRVLYRQGYYSKSNHNGGILGVCGAKLHVCTVHVVCQGDLR